MKLKFLPMVCASGAIALLSSTGGAGGRDEAIDLGPRYDAAEVSEYEHTMRIEQSQSLQHMADQTLTADMTRRIVVRTLDVLEDGGARIEFMIEGLTLRVVPPMSDVWEYDSDKAVGNPTGGRARFLDALVGLPVVMIMDSTGRVVEIVGFDQVERLMMREPRARDLFVLLNREWFEGTAQEIFGICGGERLRSPGETWTKRSATRAGGLGDGDTIVTQRIDSVEERRATIVGSGHIDVDPDAPPLIAGSETEITRQEMDFHIVWDRRLGRLERYETSQEVVLSHGGDWMDARARLKTVASMTRVDAEKD